MSKFSGKTIREECVDPTFDIVSKVRARRLRWLGHILRAHEGYLVRRVVLALWIKRWECGGEAE